MTFKKFFVLFFLVLNLSLRAQQSQYSFAHVNVNEGLSSSRAKCFLRDKQGFIWIGTTSGLNRFDGYTIKKYFSDARDTTSLVDDDINGLFEDPNGRMWVDTWSGQNIYDFETESFDRNADKALKDFGIPPGRITNIVKGSKGNYWFLHATMGLFNYDLTTKTVTRSTHIQEDSTTIFSNQVSSLREDQRGNLWIIHKNGIFEKMDMLTHKIIYRNYSLSKKYSGETFAYDFIIDKDGDLWISVNENNNMGVFYFSINTGTLLHIHKNSPKISLNSDLVRGIVQDAKGIIWIGTDHGGLNLRMTHELHERREANPCPDHV